MDIAVNVELKDGGQTTCPNPDPDELAAAVLAVVEADTKDRQIILTSFSQDILEEVRALNADVYLGRIGYAASFVLDDAEEAGFDAVVGRWDQLDEPELADVHDRGLDQAVYEINDEAEMRLGVDLGVDMIITDEPDILEAIFAELCIDFVPDPDCGDDDDDDDSADDDDDDDDDDDGGSGCSCNSSLAAADADLQRASALGLLLLLGISRRRRSAA